MAGTLTSGKTKEKLFEISFLFGSTLVKRLYGVICTETICLIWWD